LLRSFPSVAGEFRLRFRQAGEFCPTVIDVQNVTKSFLTKDMGRIDALQRVSLAIGGNEFFTLLGPSGCGKTTLLRLIGGFETPTSGAIRIDGADVAALPPQRRRVNTVFQNYALFPHMSVSQNIAFGLEMQDWPQADIARRVSESLDLVRLGVLPDVARLSSQAASSSVSHSLARSHPGQKSCCWMSRCRRSTSSCAGKCRAN
jgi:ABC-type glutathione transport system ATPase component